jgi:DNA-binding NarL/FixJ family response regulator
VGRSTVKTHVSHIMEKLGVNTRVEVVKLALKHNLTS